MSCQVHNVGVDDRDGEDPHDNVQAFELFKMVIGRVCISYFFSFSHWKNSATCWSLGIKYSVHDQTCVILRFSRGEWMAQGDKKHLDTAA